MAGTAGEAGWAACPSPAAGAGHPSQIAYGKILSRFKRLSRTAGARRSDGTELVLRPHDCRRVFASAHLNNATPIFQRMLSSHEAALERARVAREPAGQLAARELEVQRISSALRRAGDLDDDIAAAIETARLATPPARSYGLPSQMGFVNATMPPSARRTSARTQQACATRVESARATTQRDPPAGPCYSRVRRVSVSARSTGANDAE